ncbi:hypothetical protein JCM1841_000929 [Sporobolomyces salmonicolor]
MSTVAAASTAYIARPEGGAPGITPGGSRLKRRLSNATTVSLGFSDDEDDEPTKPRGKRTRPAGGAASPKAGGAAAAAGTGAGAKALTDKEKEARRQARMVRNRNAAQASRDRKKEHTAFLERRVAELEAQLRQSGPHPLAASFTAASSASSSKPPRSQRSTSVTSSAGSSSSGRVADLEDENECLRSQLHLEQMETARLRSRLDSLEDKFARLSHLMTPEPSFASPFSSSTSTPLSHSEPTFAFDTPDLKPLPQPEEKAYVEERNRQQLAARQTSATTLVTPTQTPLETSTMTDSSRLVAREVDLSLQRKLASSVSSLDLASTPPPAETYLDDVDDLAMAQVWGDWVKGLPQAGLEPAAGACEDEATTSALAFVDFTFLHEGPVAASC